MDRVAAFETVTYLKITAAVLKYPHLRQSILASPKLKSLRSEQQRPFRILDLPAEIRNKIFRFATYRNHPLRLRHFKPPAITRVSRQFRFKALPVFFDVNVFVAEVKTTYTERRKEFFMTEDVRYKQAGTLNLRRDIISLLKTAGDITVRIKNLDLVPLDYYEMQTDVYRHLPVVVSLRATEGPQRPTVTRHVTAQGSFYRESEKEDLRHITEVVKVFLETQAGRTGFNGLTFIDLKDLAHTLRVTPRGGGRQALVKIRRKRIYRARRR